MEYIEVKDMSGLSLKPGILYYTDNYICADYLKEKGFPYCLMVASEEELMKAWGHKYVYLSDNEPDLFDRNQYFSKAYYRQTKEGCPVMEGININLTEVGIADREAIYKLYEDEASKKYLEAIPLVSGEKWEEYIEGQYRCQDMYGYAMYIVRLKDGSPIGRAGFMADDEDSGILYIGYAIDARYRGRGYGFEAARLLMEYGRDKLKEYAIEAKVDGENSVSLRILNKLASIYEISINIK